MDAHILGLDDPHNNDRSTGLPSRVVNTVTEIEFHGGCPDGIGAVFPFYLKRRDDYHSNKLHIHGISHHESPNLKKLKGKVVVLLDFCYNADCLVDICNVAKELWIIDHHDTTLRTKSIIQQLIDGLNQPTESCSMVARCSANSILSDIHWIIDMKRSAAQIAWDLVYPSKPRPWFIEIIADRDLWKWEIPFSKEIGKSLYYYDYYRWEAMYDFWLMSEEESIGFQAHLAKHGEILLDQEKREIEYCVNRAVLCEFMGNRVKLTHCPPNLRSEVGNHIAGDDCSIAVMWRYDFLEDQYWISMRVPDKMNINLAELAEKFGGGGHPQAAGFTIHGPKSNIWLEASSLERARLAHGNLHDYFVILQI